jgi:YidC/Oxa1 family membrane protein insertase
VGNPLDALYEAVAWVLTQIYNLLSPVFGTTSGWTWALSIVLLVVLMRLIMVPLFIKQMHTTRAMSALTPKLTELRKKYKNDKQTLNAETMKVYQEAGVNPLMGCLPVVAQLPVFFSLFSVLRAITEWKPGQPPKYGLPISMVQSAQKAEIFGVHVSDKVLFTHGVYVPLHAKAVILVAVIISMVTTYLTVRQSMKRGMMPAATPDNPMASTQKYMAYIMPLFALSGLYWPFGLVLYWVTTNLWTLGQQWLLFKRYPMPSPAADGAAVPAPALTSKPKSGGMFSRLMAAAEEARGQQAGGSSAKGSQPDKPAAGGAGKAVAGPAKGSQQPASGRPAARPAGSGQNGQAAAAGGGVRRMLGRNRAEPVAAPPEPEVKLVRQQPQRQSRSKRSGKR